MSELWFFLPGIILLGVITSYEDIKYWKIRNKWVIGAIVYAFIMWFGLFLYYYFSGTEMNYFYWIELLINAAISLIIGFLLWYFKVWTAGDGKLFFVCSLLIPLSSYHNSYIKYFPSFNLLINIFVPAFMVFFFILLFKSNWQEKKRVIKKVLEPKQLLISIISLFAIFWIIQLILGYVRFGGFGLSMLLSFAAYYTLQKIFDKKIIWALIVITVIRLIVDKNVYTIQFLKSMLFIIGFWVILNGIINEASFTIFTKEVKIDKLRKGIVLAESIYREKGEYKKEKQGIQLIKDKAKKYLLEMEPEGLTEKELNKIRKLYKQGKIAFKTIRIQQTIPFAPFVFSGVLITIIVSGSILQYLLIKF